VCIGLGCHRFSFLLLACRMIAGWRSNQIIVHKHAFASSEEFGVAHSRNSGAT